MPRLHRGKIPSRRKFKPSFKNTRRHFSMTDIAKYRKFKEIISNPDVSVSYCQRFYLFFFHRLHNVTCVGNNKGLKLISVLLIDRYVANRKGVLLVWRTKKPPLRINSTGVLVRVKISSIDLICWFFFKFSNELLKYSFFNVFKYIYSIPFQGVIQFF